MSTTLLSHRRSLLNPQVITFRFCRNLARNDYHFNRKDWTPPQVHHAIQAYMTYNEHNPPQSSTQFAQPLGNHLSVLHEPTQIQEPPTHSCPYPASLQGSRCYVDVAVVPDNQNINTNNAGLGIFILNFQVQPLQAVYVKAQLHNCQSVLMGEAAALALGATIVKALQIQSCNFLSDSQQLVHFLHQEQQQNPPQWRIKPFTQVYSNTAASLQAQLFKINGTQNTTADTLAKQARNSTLTSHNTEM